MYRYLLGLFKTVIFFYLSFSVFVWQLSYVHDIFEPCPQNYYHFGCELKIRTKARCEFSQFLLYCNVSV